MVEMYRTGTERVKKTWISERKRLRKIAEQEHGLRPMSWHGGILYFTDTNVPVPDVPNVPKPGKQAVGLVGARPAPSPKVDRFGRAAHREPEPARMPPPSRRHEVDVEILTEDDVRRGIFRGR